MDIIEKELGLWLGRITQPRSELGNFSICPFAKKLPTIVKTSKINLDLFENLSKEITIYCEITPLSTFEELHNICLTLNEKYQSHIFLPDHPNKETKIQGIKTGNGTFPLIISQSKTELISARNKLSKTDYYSYWNKEFLEEIFNYGDLDRMGQTY